MSEIFRVTTPQQTQIFSFASDNMLTKASFICHDQFPLFYTAMSLRLHNFTVHLCLFGVYNLLMCFIYSKYTSK